MDLNARFMQRALRDPTCQKIMLFQVQFVRAAVCAYRLKAWLKEKHLKVAFNGGVALANGLYVLFYSFEHFALQKTKTSAAFLRRC